MRSGKLLRWMSLIAIVASVIGFAPVARAQTGTPPPEVLQIVKSMTPEERVGQLFLVTFKGRDTGPDSQIYDLIVNHHVGGVVLFAANDNFAAAPNTVKDAQGLINDLQNIEWAASSENSSDGSSTHVFVPLFAGIAQEGDGAPYDQILHGLTPLPDEMSIGATWSADKATIVGAVLGKELAALGFNLYLGPSLDVLESPNPSARSDLGTRVFGGDPYWVGIMGQAYINGLHSGSNGRLLVIAKHFPGRGGSDRLPEEEVATVRKSLEQLKQIELYPFFSVTGNAVDPKGTTDGLLVSHIRYQGFQGNIRATTRPVSFDPAALSQILALPQFASWRQNGGLIVSDDLGSQAVRQFYSQGGQDFSGRIVARDAFLAGNDLLYLGNIVSSDTPDTYSTTLQILNFFTQEYRLDPAFAQLVDSAVARIIAKKMSVYSSFTIENATTLESGLEGIGGSEEASFDVARYSATLISPDPQELSVLLPSPPQLNDRMVFLTDTVTAQQCGDCLPETILGADALQQTVVRLYGPSGSGQVVPSRLSSYPFSEIGLMLDNTSTSTIEEDLNRANWVILSLTDVGHGQLPLLRRFFTERPDLIRNKNVILFSFTAPYYLDATDISKLTAYYGLYSKQPAFIEVAARLLFQQVTPQGASPVSIPAVGYELIKVTAPDPNQVIPLYLDVPIPSLTPTPTSESATAEPTPIPLFRLGDTIAVRAGPILDLNHHPVPDGTVVRFTMQLRDESGTILNQVEANTSNGFARASFKIEKPGAIEIRAASEPAVISEALQLDASSDQGAAVTVVVPMITSTPMPVLPTPTPVEYNNLISPEGYPRPGLWLLTILALAGSVVLIYWAVSRIVNPKWGLRSALCALTGGLLAYNYLALGLPPAADWITSDGGALGALILIFVGELIGLGVALIWKSASARKSDDQTE